MSQDDWRMVRDAYRTEPTTSLRDLAERFGVSHTAINKRAKAEGWVRGDLKEQVRAEREAKVIIGSAPDGATQEEAIQAESQRAAQAEIGQRARLEKLTLIVDGQLEKLKSHFDQQEQALTEEQIKFNVAVLERLVSVIGAVNIQCSQIFNLGQGRPEDGPRLDLSKLSDEQLSALVAVDE